MATTVQLLLEFDASYNSKLHQKFQSPFLQKMPLVVNLRGKGFWHNLYFCDKIAAEIFLRERNIVVCVMLCRNPIKLSNEQVEFMF